MINAPIQIVKELICIKWNMKDECHTFAILVGWKIHFFLNFIMAYHYHAINIIKTSHSSLIDWRWGELVIHSKALFFVWGHMWEKYLSIISMLKLWFLQLSLYILQSTMFVHIRHRKQHLPHKLRLSNALNLLWLKAILTIIFRVIPYKKKAMKAS